MIGTGYIGGKSVGMLLAKEKILDNEQQSRWEDILELRFILRWGLICFTRTSFRTAYGAQDGQRTKEGYFCGCERTPRKNTKRPVFRGNKGTVMADNRILRASRLSSSAQALCLKTASQRVRRAKYESIFSVNQGSPEHRYRQLENT